MKSSSPSRFAILMHQLESCRPFFRASVVVTRKPCIRKGCPQCRRKQKHQSSYLIVSIRGKPKIRYLPKDLISKARHWTKNYRKTKVVIERMSRLWMEEFLKRRL